MKEKLVTTFKVFFLLNFPITILILYSCSGENFSLFHHEIRKIPQIEILNLKKNEKNGGCNHSVQNQVKSYENNITEDDIKLRFSSYTKYGHLFHENYLFPQVKILQQFENQKSSSNETTSIQYDDNEDENPPQKIKIFLVGDSMAQGISWWFERNADMNNIIFKSLAKQSTTTKYWYNDLELYENLKNFNPDVILIALGANEFLGNNVHSRLNILKLKQKISQYCENIIWILPPIEKAKDYNEIVKDIFTQKKVFDSNQIDLPRGKDKIHPTRSGFFQWSSIIYNCCLKDKFDDPECELEGNS